jgi:hypothetical protein
LLCCTDDEFCKSGVAGSGTVLAVASPLNAAAAAATGTKNLNFFMTASSMLVGLINLHLHNYFNI